MKRKGYKKIISFFLILSVVSGISACSENPDYKPSETTESSVEYSGEKSEIIQDSSEDNAAHSNNEFSGTEEYSSGNVDNDDSSDFPEEWQDDGIFSSKYQKAYELVKNMSTEEKVGQILLARCPAVDALSEAKEFHLGGYILFGRDIDGKTKNELTGDIRSYVDSQNIPMIVAVDEEGGTVSRLSLNNELTKSPFKSPRELFAEGGIPAIIEDTKSKCKLMKKLNINTNLAPVCDISKSGKRYLRYAQAFSRIRK